MLDLRKRLIHWIAGGRSYLVNVDVYAPPVVYAGPGTDLTIVNGKISGVPHCMGATLVARPRKR